MSTTDCGTELKLFPAPAQTRFAAQLMLRTKSVWRTLRNRFQANALHDLDDHQLEDIGITRHDVVKALDRSGVLDDPSQLLRRAAREHAGTRFTRR
jgi:uncharacterized protein YjiS (DUF1127 family)